MGIFTRQVILETASEKEIETLETLAGNILKSVCGALVVFSWDDAPKVIKNICNFNGGDEDWVVITRGFEYSFEPSWLEHLDSCYDPDRYQFTNCTIYVGSHA